MSVYLIADIKVTDDGWVPEYATNVHNLVEKHGGRYLSRSGNIDTLEGADKDSTLIAILEFPSREALDGFTADHDYVPFGQARQAGSVSNFHVIDDTDIAGAIPYLKAGGSSNFGSCRLRREPSTTRARSARSRRSLQSGTRGLVERLLC